MTDREKKLAMLLAPLAPLLVLFLLFSLYQKLGDKSLDIDSLESQSVALQRSVRKGRLATARLASYTSQSLPSDLGISKPQYRYWLKDLAEKEIGMTKVNVRQEAVENAFVQGDMRTPVFVKHKFIASFTGDIKQVTRLLFRFGQAKLLHRINQLTIQPDYEVRGKKRDLTGRLNVTMNIEVVALPRAEEIRAIESDVYESTYRSLEDYQHIVSRRNLFGPPDEKPSFDSAIPSNVSKYPGDSLSIPISAKDPSGNDITLELVQSALNTVKFENNLLSAADLPKGNHPLTIRATSSGWSGKTVEKNITVVVDDPVITPDTPEEVTVDARDTFFSGVTLANKQPVAWISFRLDDKSGKYKVGDSFQLDEKTWEVKSIDQKVLTLHVDGKDLQFVLGSSLAKPKNGPSTAAADTEPVKSTATETSAIRKDDPELPDVKMPESEDLADDIKADG